MDFIKNLGISYKASYLIQGNQTERCNTSTALNVKNTSLHVRTDGKDSNIENILKSYKGNIVFHIPSINPDLSNLNSVNNLVKKIKASNLKTVIIDASNLSSDLFEWSTLDEQKKYFLNIVTGIATIASNKIEVAIENLKPNKSDSKFGSNIGQLTDILVYSRRLLVKDFGFNEEEAEKYIGVSLNVNNIVITSEKESILNWFEVFNKNIKIIKFNDINTIIELFDEISTKDNILLFYETKDDLDEIKDKYLILKDRISRRVDNGNEEEEEIKKVNNKGFSSIIIYTMIVLTIVIVILMFMIKLK